MPLATWKVTRGAQHEHWRFAMQQHHSTPEEWRPVAGYERKYEVSSHGRARSLYGRKRPLGTPRILKPWLATGYPAVSLSVAGKAVKFRVHTLVLTAFVGARPAGRECAHRDGDRTNNHLSNLRWATFSENYEDARRHGRNYAGDRHKSRNVPGSHRGTGNPGSVLTPDCVREIRRQRHIVSQRALAAKFGVTRQTVSDVQLRRSWDHID